MKEKRKKKNQKRLIVIMILILAIAAAVGLVLLIPALTKNGNETVDTVERFEVFRMAGDKMERIEWQYKGEEYAIYKDGDVWKLSSDPALELYQSACKAVATSLELIQTEKFIESTDREAMGFNDPSTVVKLRADGTEYVFTFGGETGTGGYYYLEYDGKISVVASYEKTVFDKSLLSLTGEEEPIDTVLTKVELEESEEESESEPASEEETKKQEETSAEAPEPETELTPADLGETEPETGITEEEHPEEQEEGYTGIPEEEATPAEEKDDIKI